MFPKWRHALQAFAEEVRNCRPGGCDVGEWQNLVESLRGEDLLTQLRETNVRLNEKPYVSDEVNWGVSDFGRLHSSFFARGVTARTTRLPST